MGKNSFYYSINKIIAERENKEMKTRGKVKRIVILAMVLSLIMASSAFLFADDTDPATSKVFDDFCDLTVGDIIVNTSYNPISTDLRTLNWDIHTRTWFDAYSYAAFTPAQSRALGDGSADHIQVGEDSIMFFGTAYVDFFDYIYYDSPDLDNKMFEFTIDSNVDYHTLYGFGFMLNCSTDASGLTSGYAVMFGSSSILVKLIDGKNLLALAAVAQSPTGTNADGDPTFNGTSGGSGSAFNSYPTIKSIPYPTGTSGGAQKSFKITSSAVDKSFSIELNGANVFTFSPTTTEGQVSTNYPSNGSFGSDFGIFAAYMSHACSSLSYAKISKIALYSETVSEEKSTITLNLFDFTFQEYRTASRALLATFESTGYVGQTYKITPPEKIGKYVYVGDEDEITGVYGASNEVLGPETVKYANPTIEVLALNEDGIAVRRTVLDGLDINTEYIISPSAIVTSSYTPKNAGETKAVTLTKTSTYRQVSFYFFTNGDHGVAKTNDTTDALWAVMAIVSCLTLAVTVGIKRIERNAAK